MTPDDARFVADLRMRILVGIREGKNVRDLVTKEELRKAVNLTREARRQAPVVTEGKAKKKSGTSAASAADLDTLLNSFE